MSIPEILQGDVHLPLTERMLVAEALQLANTFYQTELKAEDYNDSQAFKTPDGQLLLEVSDKSTGEVVIRFVNKSKSNTVATPAMMRLWNPLVGVTDTHNYLAAPVQLASAEEIRFLDELGSGNTYPTDSDNGLAWKLASLLNEYGVAGRWMAGTYGDLSTAGFELVYKGVSSKAPAEFLIDFSPMVAILRFHNGDRKGYLCLKS